MASTASKNEAKKRVVDGLRAQFGADYLGTNDKKELIRIHTKDGDVVVALALTVPKETETATKTTDIPASEVPIRTPVEITEKEHQVITDLMAKLGI